MSAQWYPEGYWADHFHAVSKDKPAQDVCGAEAQGHADPTQYNSEIYSTALYEVQNGADASVASFPEASFDYKWSWQPQAPATEGVGSAGMHPALGAGWMNRAADDGFAPLQEYLAPSVPLMGPQMPMHILDYPDMFEQPTGEVPILVSQPGIANVVRYSGQGVADKPTHNPWPVPPFDGYGASPLGISEGGSIGGAQALTSIGCVSGRNDSQLGQWAMSTAAAGKYSGQPQFLGYYYGVRPTQTPYDPRASMRDWTQMHGPTACIIQYGQSAPATGPAELSMSWAAPGMSDYHLSLNHRQTYPSVQGGLPYPGIHAGGAYPRPNGFGALSTEVASSSPQHLSKGSRSYTPLITTGVTLTPWNHQVTSATVANATGNLIAAAPTGGAGVAAPKVTEFSATPTMSRTRTGRIGPKRGLPGRMFVRDVKKVQERLKGEGADVGAVERLHSEIFLNGEITKAALKADMTLDERKVREGKQKYMLLLEVVPRPQGSHKERDHRCLLCPPWARAEFKLREDSLRHFHKDHFGLSFDFGASDHKFWLAKELAKHVKKAKLLELVIPLQQTAR